MNGLRVLNLTGNPVIRKTTQYRKTLITKIDDLKYLDDRPVFPKERVCAVAFMAGGREAERKARTDFMEAERERQAKGIRHLEDIQRRARAERLEREGGVAVDGAAAGDLSDDEKGTAEDDETELPEASCVECTTAVCLLLL
jgi:dynein assembly factor 1